MQQAVGNVEKSPEQELAGESEESGELKELAEEILNKKLLKILKS
jgi:hypothetical protein